MTQFNSAKLAIVRVYRLLPDSAADCLWQFVWSFQFIFISLFVVLKGLN